MKNTRKVIRNIILFIALIILTFTIILKDTDYKEIIFAFSNVRRKYIAVAIMAMCLYLACDAINIGRTLKALGEKSNFWQNLKYSLIGFFYSSITPAASGGQPMQVYYMHKDNLKVANSTLTLLINLSCIQVVTLSIAFISLFFNYEYMNPALITFFIIGVGLNGSALALLLISIYSRRVSKWIINFAIKVLKFFKIKNIEDKRIKYQGELARYQESAKYARNNKKLILKTLLTTYVEYIAFYSVSYWVYRSLGFSEHNILKVITMQSILFATVSGIPSPGAVGVSEGGFIAIFSHIYSENITNSAMLITRGVSFYLFVFISMIIVMIYTIKDKKEEKIKELGKNDLNITNEEKS